MVRKHFKRIKGGAMRLPSPALVGKGEEPHATSRASSGPKASRTLADRGSPHEYGGGVGESRRTREKNDLMILAYPSVFSEHGVRLCNLLAQSDYQPAAVIQRSTPSGKTANRRGMVVPWHMGLACTYEIWGRVQRG